MARQSMSFVGRQRSLFLGSAMVLVFGASIANGQQRDSLSTVERAFLLQLGTRRMDDRNFRYLMTMNQADRLRQQRELESLRQSDARARAIEARSANSRVLRRPTTTPSEPQTIAPNSDVVIIWDLLGATFAPGDPATIERIAPKYKQGLEVSAIRVNGPADKAGWKAGDILLGLDRFRTESYSDLAFLFSNADVANAPSLWAVMIKSGRKSTSSIEINAHVQADPSAPAAAGNQAGKMRSQAEPENEPAPKPKTAKSPPTVGERKVAR